MKTTNKNQKPIDLSEYAEEAVPFDTVIRQLAKAKPVHRIAPKPRKKVKAASKK
jgi:hypothetical protein